MENQTVSNNCVALFLRGGSSTTKEQAAFLVRRALLDNSLEPWSRIHIDIFCAGSDALVIAFPDDEPSVHIADYAVEYINRYLTN